MIIEIRMTKKEVKVGNVRLSYVDMNEKILIFMG
jgi:hypothetical protein